MKHCNLINTYEALIINNMRWKIIRLKWTSSEEWQASHGSPTNPYVQWPLCFLYLGHPPSWLHLGPCQRSYTEILNLSVQSLMVKSTLLAPPCLSSFSQEHLYSQLLSFLCYLPYLSKWNVTLCYFKCLLPNSSTLFCYLSVWVFGNSKHGPIKFFTFSERIPTLLSTSGETSYKLADWGMPKCMIFSLKWVLILD